MKRAAFTLIELLIVVAILGLLVAVLAPQLSAARSLAKSAICHENLSQIGSAFQAAQAQDAAMGLISARFPPANKWPGVPMNAVTQKAMYKCPEDPTLANFAGAVEGTQFRSYVNGEKLTPFQKGEFCDVLDMGDGTTMYAFEDWIAGDYDRDPPVNGVPMFNDVRVLVHDGPPMWGEIWSTNTGAGNDQIMQDGQVLFPNCADPAVLHKPFYFSGGGETNYGINDQVNSPQVSPSTLVLLDYVKLVARCNQDISLTLQQSGRHRGKINVLQADQSVHSVWYGSIDPKINLAAWLP